MKSNTIKILIACSFLFILHGCKDKTVKPIITDNSTQILTDYSTNICLDGYRTLSDKSVQLHADVIAFISNPSQSALIQCQNDWKQTREIWEQSEAYLFGPVSTNSIDPRIDTWPVDFKRLDSIMASSVPIDQPYINQLEESLKGFHPIEYLLFGKNADKQYSQFTNRQKEYLLALSENLKTLTASLKNDWEVNGGNFYTIFSTAGNGSALYPTKKSAFEEMSNAMIGICDEVANSKIDEVFVTLDSTKEESPFAKNSLTDFTNNIQGVMNAYLSKGNTKDGLGLEDFVRTYNLSLDGAIKQKHNAAIAALNNITVPFGEAIFTQPIQVQNAVDAINSLKVELEENLLPVIKLHIN